MSDSVFIALSFILQISLLIKSCYLTGVLLVACALLLAVFSVMFLSLLFGDGVLPSLVVWLCYPLSSA